MTDLALLRSLYQDETTLYRLTSSAPPLTSEVHERTVKGRTVYELWQEEEPADRNGVNLSGELVALIGGIRADFTSYGPRHPIRRALAEFRRMCNRKHQSWYDHDGPLCSDMLQAVIEGGCSVRWCAEHYAISYPRAERLVVAGLNYVGDRISKWEHDRLLTDALESAQPNPAQ